MVGAKDRLKQLASHFTSASPVPGSPPIYPGDSHEYRHRHNFHTLSPTSFLWRAAQIEPHATAIYHKTANNKILRRSYEETSDRACGLAYYIRKNGYKRVGILATNTPAFLESIFGIAAAGSVNVAINYRLKHEDISYIFQHSDVDMIIADYEFVELLDGFRKQRPNVPILVDTDTDATEGELSGPFDDAVSEGLKYDIENGSKGWKDLETQAKDEESVIALAYTSGTASRPKGVEYTHRGAYLAAMGNVIESGLNYHTGRAKYLWTLPMFHAMGWTFPWSVTAVRGTHYCLRKIDYPEIWRLLKEEGVTHFNAAPTVNTLLCAAKEAERLPQPVRVTVAASPPSAWLFEQMSNLNLHPVHVYGLTETYGPITKGYHMPEWETIDEKEKYARMARQGHGFVTGLPVRIIKTERDEGVLINVAKDGKEIGEIVFEGNICAKGYYKDAEATRKLWAGDVLHSGDLAVWHPDGAIQILDRAKDIIISGPYLPLHYPLSATLLTYLGGENISSVALEAMLGTHPSILEVGVCAVADLHWGERPKAFVTTKDGTSSDTLGQEILQWAKESSHISRFMVPREVVVVPELPKTSTGKIKKTVLREWAKGNMHAK
jgi:acyl-CoA synthetase (AMP-forming)/AMP-acid ligase II